MSKSYKTVQGMKAMSAEPKKAIKRFRAARFEKRDEEEEDVENVLVDVETSTETNISVCDRAILGTLADILRK